MDASYLEGVKGQLDEWGQEEGGHVDPSARRFFRAARGYLEDDSEFAGLFSGVGERIGGDSKHKVYMLLRGTQFCMLEQAFDGEFGDLSEEEWLQQLKIAVHDSRFREKMENAQVATHIPWGRYRPAAALAVAIQHQSGESISGLDPGSSMTLGLRLVPSRGYFLDGHRSGEFIDKTPGLTITRLLEVDNVHVKRVVGIDKQDISYNWVVAGGYPSTLRQEEERLKYAIKEANRVCPDWEFEKADITDPGMVELLRDRNGGGGFNIGWASMVRYQMDEVQWESALRNIGLLMEDNGVFGELEFCEPEVIMSELVRQELRMPVTARLRFCENGELYPRDGLEWLVFNGGRCEKALPGSRFHEVNERLGVYDLIEESGSREQRIMEWPVREEELEPLAA